MLHKQCDWIPTHLVPLYSRTGLVSILNDTGSLFAPCQRTFDTISNAYIGIWRVSIKAKAKVDELSSGREKKIDHRTNFRFPTGYFPSECFAIETLWFITACVVFEADLCVPIFIFYQKNSEQSLTLKELSETKSKKVIEKRISDNNCNNTLYIPFSFLIVRVSWKLFIKAEKKLKKTKKSKHWRLNRIVWLKSMPNMWLWTGKKLCRPTLRVRQSGFDLVDYVDKTIFVSHSG